jgi:C4-dicarboxylate-specific signal transduction histidine kinase
LRLAGEVVLGAILRQKSEHSWRLKEESDRALRCALPDTIFVCTPEGVYLEYFCGNASDLLATPQTYLGRRLEEILGAEIAATLRAAFERAARGHECVCIEYAISQHGEPHHCEVRIAQRADGAFVCLEREVTEVRKAQAEIGRLSSELIHFERVHLMGHLTASLAHQLMQPITAILSNAEAGFRVLDAKVRDEEALRAILQDVEVCSRSAADVIRGVTDLLHKQPRPYERVSLNRIVQDVIDVMRSDLILRQVCLVAQLSPQNPEIVGDVVRLQQVVLNLFLNALDAMKERDSQQRTLVVTTTNRDAEVELRVCDCGTGIDPRYLQEMFKPFFSTKSTGMGMGLHICSEIVLAHGGRMSAQNNREGPGLTVLCVLPLA